MKVWIVTYRLRIRRRAWEITSFACLSYAAAQFHKEDVIARALSAGHDYDILFASPKEGSEIWELRPDDVGAETAVAR